MADQESSEERLRRRREQLFGASPEEPTPAPSPDASPPPDAQAAPSSADTPGAAASVRMAARARGEWAELRDLARRRLEEAPNDIGALTDYDHATRMLARALAGRRRGIAVLWLAPIALLTAFGRTLASIVRAPARLHIPSVGRSRARAGLWSRLVGAFAGIARAPLRLRVPSLRVGAIAGPLTNLRFGLPARARRGLGVAAGIVLALLLIAGAFAAFGGGDDRGDDSGEQVTQPTPVGPAAGAPPTESPTVEPTEPPVPEAPRVLAMSCEVDLEGAVLCVPEIEGEVVELTWTASGAEPSFGAGETFATQLPASGRYVVFLGACNAGGCSSGQSELLFVAELEPGDPPPSPTPATPQVTAPQIRTLGCTPAAAEVGTSIACTPSISGTVNSLAWTVNGSPAGTSRSLTTSFDSPGEQRLTLRACNTGGCDTATATVAIEVPVPNPELEVTPALLDLGIAGTSAAFTVRNAGGRTLDWTASADQPWVSLAPASGSVGSGSSRVTLLVDRTGLPAGVQSANIEVLSIFGTALVTVTITVEPPASLVVSPSSLNFFVSGSTRSFSIRRVGDGALDWTIATDQPWLTVNPTSGTTEFGADDIDVTVSRAGLPLGTYEGGITINWGSGSAVIPVAMERAPPPAAPRLEVTRSVIDFGNSDTADTFEVSNSGGLALNWSVSSSEPWVSVAPSSGTEVGDDATTVNVTVSRGSLADGSYAATLSVTSNGGSQSIDVQMVVDTTGPVVAAPPPLEVILPFPDTSTNATESPAIGLWLQSASAFDAIEITVDEITNDAVAPFSGETTVTFSALDSLGNLGTAQSTLTVTVTALVSVTAGAGGNASSPQEGPTATGTLVSLLAIEDPGFVFDQWTGASCPVSSSPSASEIFTLLSDSACTATFAVQQFTLSVLADAGGTASSPQEGLNPIGTPVTLTAVPGGGFVFDQWTGGANCPISGSTLAGTGFNLSADATCTATFAVQQFTLTLLADAGGTASSPQEGLNPIGTPVTLTATASGGFLFNQWIGGASCPISGSALANDGFNLTADATCTATFTAQFTLTVLADAGGTASSPQEGLNPIGTPVTLTAFPSGGFVFDQWTGGPSCPISGSPIESTGFNITADATCTATFSAIPNPTLSVTIVVDNGDGTGSAEPGDFTPTIDTVPVVDGAATTVSVGPHTAGSTGVSTGYVRTIGGDCAADGTITLVLGQVASCSVTYDDIPLP